MPPRLSLRLQPHLIRPSTIQHHQTRTFLPNLPFVPPFSPQNNPQTLTARRTLPYPAASLYDLIADIDAYASFLPYCTESRVTAWSVAIPSDNSDLTFKGQPQPQAQAQAQAQAQSQSRRYPRAGRLTVGWGPVSASYTSSVYCVPRLGIVEAVSGTDGVSDLTPEERNLVAGGYEEGRNGELRRDKNEMFKSLVTRWTVRETKEVVGPGRRGTDVELRIRYAFANPMYQVAVGKVGEEVAGLMVEAFERRAGEVLGGRR